MLQCTQQVEDDSAAQMPFVRHRRLEARGPKCAHVRA